MSLRKVTLTLCEPCIQGAGGECHTPGCALWMNRAPDIPINLEPVEVCDELHFDARVALPEAQERFKRAERERDDARRAFAEFRDGLTEALNAAGVPACPTWPEAINTLVRERDSARKLYLSTGEALDRTDDQRLRLRRALVDLLLFGERLMQSDSMEERAIGVVICEGARIVGPTSKAASR